ncbi:hypothetical protein HK104_001382 [Borealophlyctis nickersoniae]|nr:hypothetical protein HK104_001382 [Borealophlyctis nickersoniae]
MGATNTPFLRTLPFVDYYSNATSAPDPPGSRNISNALASRLGPVQHPRQLTDFVTYWGEFITMDITHTFKSRAPGTTINIGNPTDPFAATSSPANASMPFNRVNFTTSTAVPRVQINSESAWIDASHIYGNEPIIAASLREDNGRGAKFALDGNSGLPKDSPDSDTFINYTVPVNTGSRMTDLFRFGQSAGNTHPIIQSLYIIFMREHNRYVTALQSTNSSLSPEALYQAGRTHVISLIQHITYKEYLPIIYGFNPIPNYSGYNASVDATIDGYFEAVSFRYGHSEVNDFMNVARDGDKGLDLVPLKLKDIIFSSQPVRQSGIEAFLVGAARTVQQPPGGFVVSDLRNILFGNRPMDLFAVDIERARDFGIPLYNRMRVLQGRAAARTFSEISSKPDNIAALQAAYPSPDLVDALVGGLMEDREPSSNLGPLFNRSIADQFRRLRDGDRFWFEIPGVVQDITAVRNTRLRDVILRNSRNTKFTDANLPQNLWQLEPSLTLPTSSSSFPYKIDLDPAMRLSWMPDTVDGVQVVRMELLCAALRWCGIGFGTGMDGAEFIVVRALDGGKISADEYTSNGRGQVPSLRRTSETSPSLILSSTGTTTSQGIVAIIVRRNANLPTGRAVAKLDGQRTDIIFAFNKVPVRSGEQWFLPHGLANRGKASINFATGESDMTGVESDSRRTGHALGMAVIWLFVFPFAVFYSRYLRHTTNWMYVHMCLQASGAMVVLFMAGWIIFAESGIPPSEASPHSYIGFVLIAVVVFQVVAGILNRQRLSSESLISVAAYIRRFHNYVGRGMIVAGFIQAGFGLRILFPVTGPDARPMGSQPAWIVYFIVVALWCIVFVAAETYFQLKIRSVGFKSDKPSSPSSGAKSVETIFVAGDSLKKDSLKKSKNGLPPYEAEAGLPGTAMTWRDVGEKVKNGGMLVVGNGRYIYDITSWAAHHPGGRLILNMVVGSDITVDFFNEANFDNASFVPKKYLNMKHDNVPRPKVQKAEVEQNGTDLTRTATGQEESEGEVVRQNLTEEEWAAVRKSRMTHRHGKLAVQKLVTFMIGQLVDERTGRPLAPESTTPTFNAHEYRRYALVSRELATSSDADIPVYRIRFALVHPFHAIRANEPTRFLPGQCIEILDRVGTHGLVTRYYTPISGSPSCFDLLVKCYPDGLMGSHLMKRKPGDRQFRIRGPLGTPLLNPDRPVRIDAGEGYFETLVLIGGGAGLTPCLQFVKEYFLPVGRTVVANEEYVPDRGDEMTLVPGDRITVMHESGDGWAYGINKSTHEEGSFPLSLVTPPPGSNCRVMLINCTRAVGDMIGTSILGPASLAFPNLLSIHTFTSHPTSTTTSTPAYGEVHPHRLSPEDVTTLVGPFWAQSQGGAKRIVMCGPAALESMCFDTLVEECGVESEDVVVLPPETFFEGERSGV